MMEKGTRNRHLQTIVFLMYNGVYQQHFQNVRLGVETWILALLRILLVALWSQQQVLHCLN